jgi:hypothetical protein
MRMNRGDKTKGRGCEKRVWKEEKRATTVRGARAGEVETKTGDANLALPHP